MDYVKIERDLRAIHARLVGESLEPSDQLSEVMSGITETSSLAAAEGDADRILRSVSDILPSLRRMQSTAESLLERSWAQRVIASNEPKQLLRSFPYYRGYGILVESEVAALKDLHDANPRAVSFIGCGPLPISAIVLAESHGMRVSCIDSDQEAISLAEEVVRKIGLETLISFTCENVLAMQSIPARVDAVFVAALVGENTEQKRKIFSKLAELMDPSQTVCARSAKGLRALHYFPVEQEHMHPFFVRGSAYPLPPVVNHTLMGMLPT